MRVLELKVPPVVVFLVAAVLMWWMARVTPAAHVTVPMRWWLASAGWLVGVVLGALGVRLFQRAGTTISPLQPENASVLVVSGIYRWTRNPMYLALLVLLGSWAIVLANLASVVVLPAFVAYLTRFQIVPEERELAARFGEAFAAYRQRVRRWL